MYYVYILGCLQTGRTYVGQTDNLLRRFRLHPAGTTRTTRERFVEPVLLHWEGFATRAEAMARERYYKSGSGHRVKLALAAEAFALFRPAG